MEEDIQLQTDSDNNFENDQDHLETTTNDLNTNQENLEIGKEEDDKNNKEPISRTYYIHKVILIYKLISTLADQAWDFYTIIFLSLIQQYVFAVAFFLADTLPALSVLWEKFKVLPAKDALKYSFQPVNLILWNLQALRNQKHEETFKMVKSAHTYIEAPLQLILSVTLISMGIFKLPGSEEKVITNAYNIPLNMTWLPIVSMIFSLLAIFFGTKDSFLPFALQTNKVMSFLAFILLFIFRMLVWIILTILLERFALIPLGLMLLVNTAVLFLYQKNGIRYDPLNFGFLSLVIPNWLFTSLTDDCKDVPELVCEGEYNDNPKGDSRNDFIVSKSDNQGDPLKMLFGLVLAGNVFLVLTYVCIYVLYLYGFYNPWCTLNLSQLLFEEEMFKRSFWLIVTLFLAATLPTVVVVLQQYIRISNSNLQKVKTCFIGFLSFSLLATSIWIFIHGLGQVTYSLSFDSTVEAKQTINATVTLDWSKWEYTGDGDQIRERICRSEIFQQRNSTGPKIINYDADDDQEKLRYEGSVKNKVPSGNGTMMYRDGSEYFGQWSNGQRQGQGTFNYSLEDVNKRSSYVGSWKNDEKNGFGTTTWINDEIYEGDWLNDLRHGKGKHVYSNVSSGLFYEGEWVEDKKTGKGIFILKSGEKYEGDFLNDLRHGKGKYLFSNESPLLSYEGDWVENKRTGKGVLIGKDGRKYEGDFLNDLRHGKGKHVFSNESSELSYEGDWVEDKRTGKGVYNWKDGSKYEGDWLNDFKHGNGTHFNGPEYTIEKIIGQHENGRANGRVEVYWRNGDKYIGQFKDDKLNGEGIKTYADGKMYKGDWLNDLYHGKGKLVFSNESPYLSYEGDWVENVPSGKGVEILKDGEKYEGDWLNSLKHGKGKLVFSNESEYLSYEGDWVKGDYSGKGVFIWKDGSKYEGDFLNDLRHGKGKLVFSNESPKLSYEGDWVEDKKSGKGVFIWKNGQKYEGDFLNDSRHGKGKHVFSNESSELSYEGDWVEDKISGKGVSIWKDESKYEGDFLNGLSHGNGTLVFAPSSIFEKYIGQFENEQLNGRGELYWKNGDKYIGQFKDDKFHGEGIKTSASGEILQQGKWENDDFVI